MAYKCGEKPGIGRYVCTKCGEDLHLDNSDDVVKISILITLMIDYHHVLNVITVHLGKDKNIRSG